MKSPCWIKDIVIMSLEVVVKTQVLKGTFDLKRSFDDLALVLRRVLAVDGIHMLERVSYRG